MVMRYRGFGNITLDSCDMTHANLTHQYNHGQPWTSDGYGVNNGGSNNCVLDLCVVIIITSTVNFLRFPKWCALRFGRCKVRGFLVPSFEHQFENFPDVCRWTSLPDFLLKKFVYRRLTYNNSVDPCCRHRSTKSMLSVREFLFPNKTKKTWEGY